MYALYGIGLGSELVPAAMLPDVIDAAAVRDGGVRSEALFYAYDTLWQKVRDFLWVGLLLLLPFVHLFGTPSLFGSRFGCRHLCTCLDALNPSH